MAVSVGDVLAIIDKLHQTVRAIKQAREAVKGLKRKTDTLVKEVEMTEALFKPVSECVAQTSDPSKVEVLKSMLDDLAGLLTQVKEKLEALGQVSDRVKAGSHSWETAKSLFGGGAARASKSTAELTDEIGSHRQRLHQAIGVRSLTVGVETLTVGVETLAIGVQTRAAVQKLVQERYRSAKRQYSIVSELERLAGGCDDDGSCIVTLRTAESHSNEFRVPARAKPVMVPNPNSEQEEATRGARDGGYEVGSCTKIRLEIEIDDDERFLNIVTFDNLLNEPPELYFPRNRRQLRKCNLTNVYKRMFPDETTNEADPASFKVEKDASLPVDAVHQQSVYVVLTSTQPYEDDTKTPNIKDLEKLLGNDSDVFVKRFVFDMK